jgi:hypothetical protein
MQTVFSHIIQKRFSQVNEDVSTDAMAFILNSSEAARNGMMKLLRGIAPSMPTLRFQSQQTEKSIRPDLWGFDEAEPHVYIENKFWAGLTDNQPISYLKQLAKYNQPTILLVIVPDAREQTLWREMNHRLKGERISAIDQVIAMGSIVYSTTTEIGPILALTSWTRLLSVLELEVADEPSARSDLLQLRALCESADNDAFLPISSFELTDQRTPAFVLQLGSIVQASVDLAITNGILNIKGVMPQANWERVGRYANFSNKNSIQFWFGIHFGLWKKHGGTPLWILFYPGKYGHAHEVRTLLEPWAAKEGVFTSFQNGEFAVAVEIVHGEEKDHVIRGVVEYFEKITAVLSALEIKTNGIE